MIGNSVVTFHKESNIIITGKHLKGRRRLWELLTRKDVKNKGITESDLKNIRTI